MLNPAQTGMVWEDVSSDIDTTSSGVYTVRYARKCGDLVVFSVVMNTLTMTAGEVKSQNCFKTLRPLGNMSLAVFLTVAGDPLISVNLSTTGQVSARTNTAINGKQYQVSGCFVCA